VIAGGGRSPDPGPGNAHDHRFQSISFNRAFALSLTEQVVHLYAAGRRSTAPHRRRRQVAAPGRHVWLHAGSKIEDFSVTRDCEHQNDAPDDILRGNNDLIEGAAMPDEGWPCPHSPGSPGSDRLPASSSGDD
jgi:hypothetical protein